MTQKKILILGGANQHLKFVEAAKELGLYTIVTDYLNDSPCKKVCDEALMYNITDIDNIVKYCQEHHVDGVVVHRWRSLEIQNMSGKIWKFRWMRIFLSR